MPTEGSPSLQIMNFIVCSLSTLYCFHSLFALILCISFFKNCAGTNEFVDNCSSFLLGVIPRSFLKLNLEAIVVKQLVVVKSDNPLGISQTIHFLIAKLDFFDWNIR